MKESIIIRPAARRDIDNQADYIGKRNRAAGRRFYGAAQKAINYLASMPQAGSLYECASPALEGLRYWTIRRFKNFVIFYKPTDQGITVVRLLHGAMDIERILEAEPGL